MKMCLGTMFPVPALSRGLRVEKPIFHTIPTTTQLKDLVGPHSFMFFIILGVNYEGLFVTPSQCSGSSTTDTFRDARNFVTTVKVLNDFEERVSR